MYFLFDLMSGGDLMDVLVSEAQVIKMRVAQGALKRGCFAPQVWCRLPLLLLLSALLWDAYIVMQWQLLLLLLHGVAVPLYLQHL